MKKILTILLASLSMISAANANPKQISIVSPYSPGHGGHASMLRVLEVANQSQKKYLFIQEVRPGAQGVLALRHIQEDTDTRLAIIHAAHVDNIEKGMITESDYIPVHAVGDACWAVGVTVGNKQNNTISSLRTAKELTVGTVGQGNVSHLTAIAIAEQYKIDQRVVLFKSNYDAVINLIGNNGVNFVVERVSVLQGFQSKTPDLRLVGMSCSERHPDAPELQTLAEQGFNLPSVFNIVMAHKNMSAGQRQEIAKILDQATLTVGKDEIRRMSDFVSPVFAGKLSAQQFYDNRITAIKNLRTRYRSQISSDK